MAVSEAYLRKARFAIRKAPGNPDADEEIVSLIEECRADLRTKGVPDRRVLSEEDPLILGAVRCYLRWHFPLSTEDAPSNRADYLDMAETLRKAAWP